MELFNSIKLFKLIMDGYLGFWCFILSNALWVLWGWHDGAYALIGLQVGLFFMNFRGVKKNELVSTKDPQ